MALLVAAAMTGGCSKSDSEVHREYPRAALDWTRCEPPDGMIYGRLYRVMDKETGHRWWVIDQGSYGVVVLDCGRKNGEG